jgi:hypothetical protein
MNCGKYYTESKEAEKELNICFDTKSMTTAILQCECGHRHGIGLEYEESHPYGDEPGAFTFGFDPEDAEDKNIKTFMADLFGFGAEDEENKNIKTFMADMLVETEETETGFSTWSNEQEKVINLKRKAIRTSNAIL